MSSQPEALIPATFIYSLMPPKCSQLSESVGLSFTPLTSPLQFTPTPPSRALLASLSELRCFPFLKIKPLHYIVLLKVQNFLKSFSIVGPFYLYISTHQYSDPQFPSPLSEGLLRSSCLFKSHVSLEISFNVSSLSLYSLLISPLAAICLTLQ